MIKLRLYFVPHSSSPCDPRVTKIHVHNLINMLVIIKKIPCKSVNPFSFVDHFNFGYKPLLEKPPRRAAVFDFGNSPGHGERFFTWGLRIRKKILKKVKNGARKKWGTFVKITTSTSSPPKWGELFRHLPIYIYSTFYALSYTKVQISKFRPPPNQ